MTGALEQPARRNLWARLTRQTPPGGEPVPNLSAANPADGESSSFVTLFGAEPASAAALPLPGAPVSLGEMEIPSRLPPAAADNANTTEARHVRPAKSAPALSRLISGPDFMSPRDLERPGQDQPARVLAIGSCFLGDLLGPLNKPGSGLSGQFVLANGIHQSLDQPPSDITTYDCQVLQIPLRAVMNDTIFTDLDYADSEGHQAAFIEACTALRLQLRSKMRWNIEHGILTFVFGFMQPQFAPYGRFFPRYDLRNPQHFVSCLNQELESLLGEYRRAYLVDVDSLAASFGRRHLQDDLLVGFNHNALFNGRNAEPDRMEPVKPAGTFYHTAPGATFRESLVAELRCMLRIQRQADNVKLVVLDLDDTLWRGVSGDTADLGPQMVEGWPSGLIEALAYVRKRGVVLAIASKNDEARVRATWSRIFGNRLKLEDFGVIRINWQPKVQNMREILEAVNVLPASVLFIDDNPAERAAMIAAFPDMRMLGQNPFHIRRILLQAAEMQVEALSSEGARRTRLIQAQVERETERASVSAEDFARAQKVAVTLGCIESAQHLRFPRAFELINKTNQFNTTGRRWTMPQSEAFFRTGGRFVTFEVQDRFTPYGLVGVVLLRGSEIVQCVMSCRVIGMNVEQAVLCAVVAALRRDSADIITATLLKTDSNQPCQLLFARAGFVQAGDKWTLPDGETPAAPAYVVLSDQQSSG